MGPSRRRIRLFLDDWFAVVVVALLLFALGGGAVTYATHVEPGSHVEKRPGTTTQYVADYSHEATVTKENPVFPVGRTLSNRKAYISRIAPVLNGSFSYRVESSGKVGLTANGTLTLVIRSVGDGDGTVYWQTSRRLDRVEGQRLRTGETMRLSFSERISDIQDEIDRISQSLGTAAGTVEVDIVANVAVTGRIDGNQVSRNKRYELGIEPGGSLYRVEDPGTDTVKRSSTERVRVTNSYGPLRRVGGPAAVVVGLLGLLSLVVARYLGVISVDGTEREIAAHASAREEYDEWITTARQYDVDAEDRIVEVDSLDGLVDVAIDSGRRVIESEASGEYLVIVDDVVYRYTAPAETPRL